ncbi:MAG: NCS2 family permease [Phycisphaerae bacterium]|nr:NCS2 family permease [Phycisphaerae bacterium]
MFERLFHIREHNTTIGREIIGGAATFMALSYIVIVQPIVLSSAGMNPDGVFVATCVCSAFACILMGLWSNLPIALAPAMGHNFFFAFTICGAAAVGGMGWSWQEALAANLVAGAVFVVLAATGLQEAVIRGIPASLKYAIAVGIGLLIAFVGLQWGGLVVDNPAVYVQLGDLGSPVALLTLFGLAATGTMLAYEIRGAMLYGVLLTTAVGLIASHYWADGWGYALATWQGDVVSGLPDTGDTIFGVFAGCKTLFTEHTFLNWLMIIYIFLILDLFDTVGTLIGVAERAGLVKDGTIPRAKQALITDGVGTVAGTLMGTSTITSYVESAAGVAAGARTGLAPIVTGLLLLASLFFHPIVEMVGGDVDVPAESLGAIAAEGVTVTCHPVIAPVLIIIGCYMMPVVTKIKWDDMTEALPAFLTIVVMQFGMSISHGIAWGFISYVLLKLVRGRVREIHPLIAVFAALFVVFLIVE